MFGSWLVESCPTCKDTVGTLFVVEESAGEDCNGIERMKEYREAQKGPDPFKCNCGTNLVPSVRV